MIAAIWTFIRRHFAILVVVITFLWSAVAIVNYRYHKVPPGAKIVLRLGHWQLEAGIRKAFDQLAQEYQKLHPDVCIIQDAIPETTYCQWLTTQLMGGTASDIIEIGIIPYNIVLGFYSRYFLPLTGYLNQPNPYNKGTDLEGIPWRKTYKDGMRNSYIEELQEYMLVPLSQHGLRIFYNKNLLKRLTGLNTAPRNYREFLAACEKIKSQKDEHGKPYIPIAGSAYHIQMWDNFMCAPLTYGAVRRVDFNRDGSVGGDELFVGFKTGRINYDFQPFETRLRIMGALTEQFQPGFAGLTRDEAVFLFAQQNAVFISTGSWDAGSLQEQTEGSFEVGVMDFPIPAPDDPEYGQIIEGPIYERRPEGFSFAITRSCKHPEVALDFLHFLSSQQINQELNRIIYWIPAIKGANPSPFLRAFDPHLEGMYDAMPLGLGGETFIKWMQLYALYQVHQISYEKMVAEFLPFYLEHGVEEYAELQRNRQRGVARDEQFLAGFRVRAMAAQDAEAQSLWIKYRQFITKRLMYQFLAPALLLNKLNTGSVTNAVGPYEFSPEVIARVRARLHPQGEESK